MKSFKPSDYQPHWEPGNFIVQMDEVQKGPDDIELDVLYVGAGPASLASAIKLADLVKQKGKEIQIGIMEKAEQLGGHILSGAVINPIVLKRLFPDKDVKDLPLRKKVTKEAFYYLSEKRAFRLPIPYGMKSKGYWTASLCEVVRFLGEVAEQKGIHVFTSFPAGKLIMDKNKVVGVISQAYGVNKDGTKESYASIPSNIFTKLLVLSEGARGHLTQSYLLHENIKSKYPQTYALGVKELWEVKQEPEGIFHSLGWPLDCKSFGGSWAYPLGDNLMSIGFVAGLDSERADLNVHGALQKIKTHPLFEKYLKNGRCVEWGAKTIPEGGYYALPKRLHGEGVLILGDSAGMVNMASLKGVHYAMASGYYAAEVIYKAFESEDFSSDFLQRYDQMIKESFITRDLYIYRNFRQSFKGSLLKGLWGAGLITLTRGVLPLDFNPERLQSDSEIEKQIKADDIFKSTGPGSHSKTSAVYLSGNKTRDKIPSHLIIKDEVSKELGSFYEKMCPAGVYEQKKDELIVNAPNCIDCKATDVLGPRWTPRERGSGPNYKKM